MRSAPCVFPVACGRVESDAEWLLHLDRQRLQAARGQLALGLGEVAGGAVRSHAYAIDRLALDLCRFDACAETEQSNPRLELFGLARSLEGTGLQQVTGVVIDGSRCRGRGRSGGSGDR